MTDDNFDTLWANFKRSLVEARENRTNGSARIRMKDGHVFVESGEDNEGGLMIFREAGNKATVYPTRQEFEELAAHCLLAAEEMKPETNYKPNTPTR